MKMYGLRHKVYGNLGVEILLNNTEGVVSYSNDIEYRLSVYWDILWMIEEKELVENILSKNYDIDWYNSSYEQPVNPYNNEDLEIVEFNIEEKVL